MADQDRGDDGSFAEEYPPAVFVDALAELGEATTAEVAATVECSRRTATRRLRELAAEGRVERRDVGAAALWSLAGD